MHTPLKKHRWSKLYLEDSLTSGQGVEMHSSKAANLDASTGGLDELPFSGDEVDLGADYNVISESSIKSNGTAEASDSRVAAIGTNFVSYRLSCPAQTLSLPQAAPTLGTPRFSVDANHLSHVILPLTNASEDQAQFLLPRSQSVQGVCQLQCSQSMATSSSDMLCDSTSSMSIVSD